MATARTMRLSRVAAAAGGAWLSLLSAAAASAAPSVTDVRLGPYGEGTRLVVELGGVASLVNRASSGPIASHHVDDGVEAYSPSSTFINLEWQSINVATSMSHELPFYSPPLTWRAK